MEISLRRPFDGEYPVTFGFGAVPDNPTVVEQYKRWGLVGHNGLDYGLPEGTEVLSCDQGKVVQAGDNGDFGISVTIEHAWGQSLYAHLQQTTVSEGQAVKKGDLLGYSGQTGNAFSPHLHFAIKPREFDPNNGYLGYTDPTPYLPWNPESGIPNQEEMVSENIRGEERPDEKIVSREPTEEELTSLRNAKLRGYLQKAVERKKALRVERRALIFAYIQTHQKTTNKDLQKLLPQLSQSTISNYLEELVRDNKIIRDGQRGTSSYRGISLLAK